MCEPQSIHSIHSLADSCYYPCYYDDNDHVDFDYDCHYPTTTIMLLLLLLQLPAHGTFLSTTQIDYMAGAMRFLLAAKN